MRPGKSQHAQPPQFAPFKATFLPAGELPGYEYLRLLDRGAALWLTVAHSTERQSLGASNTCTAHKQLCNRLVGFGFGGPVRKLEHLPRIEGVFYPHRRPLWLGSSSRWHFWQSRGAGDRQRGRRRVPIRRRPQEHDRNTHNCHSEGHVANEIDSRRARGGKVLVLRHG